MQSSKREMLEKLLATLEDACVVLPIDRETAIYYANIRTKLKSAGSPIPENDIWIGALAAQHQLTVVSRDRHFHKIEEIRYVAW